MESGYVLSTLEVVPAPGGTAIAPALTGSGAAWRQQDESDGGCVTISDLLTSPALVMCYVEAEVAVWTAIEADSRFTVIYREPIVEVV